MTSSVHPHFQGLNRTLPGEFSLDEVADRITTLTPSTPACEVPGMVAKRVIYEGRVQGVGFRYTCKDVARGYDVTGSVRNLANGTVELVACGETAELDDFLREVAEDSPVAHHIKSAMVETIEGGPAKGFQILRD